MRNICKRVMLLLLALTIALSGVTAFATEVESYVAQNTATTQCYTDINEAISQAQSGQIVKLLSGGLDAAYQKEGVILDLNGYDLKVTVAEGVTVSAMDSATDDYAGEYGSLTTEGAVATTVKTSGEVKSYLTIAEGNSYSFHRYYAAIEAISLKPAEVAFGYRAQFRGDEAVKAAVVNYGYELWVNDNPHKQYVKTDALESSCLTLRLKNILVADDDTHNAIGSTATIGGNAFVTVHVNGKTMLLYGTEQKNTLRQVIESMNASVDCYSEAQLQAVRDMITAYEPWMQGWATENIFADKNILIASEEFLYGSYFDHDRFEGNTGTRITSGDYGKIRSADALLPAQTITIKVKDTDLRNYKVTLGYFDKDGVYTGRTGILPMTDGELTISVSEIRGAYFRVNVYIYNGKFTKVPETAQILVCGQKEQLPDPEEPTDPTDPVEPTDPTDPVEPTDPTDPVEPTDPTDPVDPTDPPEKPWEGKKISILGDSISTGGYPGILKELTGATFQNLSVSGTRLAGGLTGKVANVDADADLVIVFGGTNDYWHKATKIGAVDSTDPSTFAGALNYLLKTLQTNNPAADYLFVFPADQTFGGNPCSTDFGYGTLGDFRAAFLAFCNRNHVAYVDLSKTEFDSAVHSGDGVHPNSAGHRIIAQAIFEKISGKLEKPFTQITVNRQVRVLPTVTEDLPEGALASAPGVVFATAPYAYTNTALFSGKHITRIGIPVKSVAALDENQTFTLSVVKTTSDTYQYVSQNVLKLPLEQLGQFTTVNKWVYVDVDLQLAQDETLAFGMPTDTVQWGYSSAKTDRYLFRSANGAWNQVNTASILFDIYATETLEFTQTEYGLAAVTKSQVLPDVLSHFPESAIAGGDPVEFAYPPYSYVDQTRFAGKHITRLGIPVQSVAALDENQLFTLSVVKTGSGSYQYVKEISIYLPLEQLGSSTTVNKWIYVDLDLQLTQDETLAFGGKNDTVIWAWKRNYADTAYSFRDALGNSTKGIFFDITAVSVLTYADYEKQLQQEQERLEAEREQARLEALLQEQLRGKGISILGDSISTFQNWSNNTSYNATIGSNAVYYTGSKDGFAAVNETWWMQTITRSGLELVVNNSWSGDRVTDRGISRSLQLHNNQGRNPDIIAVYLGINDFRTKVTVDAFQTAYDNMISGILQKYETADVYLFTLLYTTNVNSGVNPADVVNFNAVIEETAEKYGCTLVDIYNGTGITPENLATYMGDGNLHPNYAGMDLITKCFLDALMENYLKEQEDPALIASEEFLYGSYFDHDRFEGNTGTRITSGDYGKIRSADALLPAQTITIKVKDTDLSHYKVTLGYYDKDGVYTGRTGILPMTDGELTISVSEMRGAYFRVNVYIYNGKFTKVPETAQIIVYGQ